MRIYRHIVFLLSLAAVTASAQTFRGAINGTVEDPSGAVLAGAKVEAVNTATGVSRTTETGPTGVVMLVAMGDCSEGAGIRRATVGCSSIVMNRRSALTIGRTSSTTPS